MKNKVLLIGAGNWGIALKKVLTENNSNINWYIHDNQKLKLLQCKNPDINFFNNLHQAIDRSDYLFITTPSYYLRELFLDIGSLKKKRIISFTKGIFDGLFISPTQYFNRYHNIDYNNIAFISGPSHAEELFLKKDTFLTSFSTNKELSFEVIKLFEVDYIHFSTSPCILEAEYSSALKNVMAIAIGIVKGCGYGDNFVAGLTSYSMKEIKTFLENTTGFCGEFLKPSFAGDVLVTCYSKHSRNGSFGKLIGEDYSTQDALSKVKEIVEGYYSIKSIKTIIDNENINAPICEMVYNILYNKVNLKEEIKQLISKLN